MITPTGQDNTAKIKVLPSRQVAKHLLDIGAVIFSVDKPFTWTSGIKSPIYCDNRLINSAVNARDAVIREFTKVVSDHFLDRTDMIAGVATGGMTYGVLIADRLALPFVYVRSERKEHGLKRIVEGSFKEGDQVILIEDQISTGKSSLKAIQNLREEGIVLICLLSVMTYGFKEANEKFRENNVLHYSICDLDTILSVAEEEKILSPTQVQTILDFRVSPKDWKP
jgi:orotate phosphoribosyltransferase